MAAPSATIAAPAPPAPATAKPDASVYTEPQQPLYVAPSVLSKPPAPLGSNTQAPMVVTGTTAEVIDEPPPPHTLAKGKYEVKSATIWIVLALSSIVVMLYVLWRVRSHELAKKKARAKLTALKPLGKMRA
jgi:hypothetical protein